MVGRHQASRAVAILLVADHPVEDDLVHMDVFTVATRVITRRITYFTSNSLLQHKWGFWQPR